MAQNEERDISNFRECVGGFIAFDPAIGRASNRDRVYILATKFGVTITTVEKWAAGVLNPLPRFKQVIIKFIIAYTCLQK